MSIKNPPSDKWRDGANGETAAAGSVAQGRYPVERIIFCRFRVFDQWADYRIFEGRLKARSAVSVLFQTASAPCRAGYRRPPLGRFGHPSSNHLSGKRAVKV